MTIGSDVNPPRRRKERRTTNDQQAQWQYQADLLDQLSDAVIAVDLDGCITYLNRAAVAQYRVDPAGAIGQPLSYVHRYEWLQPEDELLADAALAQQGRWRGENRHIRRDGSTIQVESLVTLLRDGAGNATGLLATIRDITDRKQMERDLRASELRYRRLADTLPQLVWSADVVGVTDYYNVHIHDFDPSVWQGTKGFDWESLLHPDDLAPTLAAWQEAVTQRRPYTCEHRLHMADGSWRWHLSRALLVQDPENGLRWYGTATDIHERKTAEEQLAFQAGLLDYAYDALIATDAKLKITAWNRGAEEMYGWRATEALGRTVSEVTRSALTDEARAAALQQLAQQGRFQIEAVTHHRDGTPILVEGYNVAMRDSDGQITGYMSVSRDIGERKAGEEALRVSEERYRTLFETMEEGFCVFELLYDDAGRAVDYRFLEVNPAFARLTGLEKAVGKTAYELVPNLEPRWVALYGEVARTGEARHLIEGSTLGRWLEVHAFRFGGAESRRVALLFTDITERKLTEDALRDSEEELRYTVELNPQVPWTADPAGNIISFNQRWLDLTGMTEDEALGGGWVETPHPDDVPAMVTAWTHAIQTGEPYDIEHRIRLATGDYRWMRSRAFPRRDKDGAIVRWYGTTEDIHEQKVVQEALRQSESAFRILADAAPALVWVCSSDGNNIYMNARWHEYTSQSEAEAAGFGWATAMHPTDAAAILPYWEQCRATGQPYEGEVRYRRHDGEYCWHLFRALPRRDDAGRITAWYGCSVDIHQAKVNEQALRQATARFERAERAAHGFVFESDLVSGQVVRSPNFTAITGYAQDEVAPMAAGWMALIHPADLARFAEQNLLADGATSYNGEYRVRHKEGHYFWMQEQGLIERDESGRPVAIIGTTLDITARKQAEDALRASEARLRQLADTMPQIVWQVDATGQNVYFNQRWVDYTGITLAESLADANRALHPADQTEAVRHWEEVRPLGQPYEFELRLRRADGVYRWHLTRCEPVYSAMGQLLCWYGTSTDIHDRKEAELALRTSEERLRLATTAGGVGIFDHDLLTNQTEISPVYAQITSLPLVETMPREAWLACVHPEDRSMVEAIWENARATGASYYYECRLIRPDGVLIWVEVNAWVTTDDRGLGVRITGAVRDITERKQAALHQQFLLDLNSALRPLTSAAAIQQTVVTRLGEYLNVGYCRFNAIDRSADKAIVMAAWSQFTETWPADIAPLSAYLSPTYIAQAQAGRTLVVHDAHQDTRPETPQALLLRHSLPAQVRVPCLRNGQWVASLNVLHNAPRQWRDDEVQLIESVVHHFWPLVEKVLADEARRASEERLRLALAAARMATFEYDVVAGTVRRSVTAWQVQGLAEQDSPDAYFNHLPLPDREALQRTMAALTPTQDSYELVYRFIRPDTGATLWLLDRAQAFFDEGGALQRISGVVLDITERKQAEADAHFLADLAETIRLAGNAETLIAAAIPLLGDHLQLGRCLWIEVDQAQDRGMVRYQHCRDQGPTAAEFPLSTYSDATRAAMNASLPLVIHDTATDPRTADRHATLYAPRGVNAVVNVPFSQEGVWRTLLSATVASPRQWETREVRLLETAAERIWLALEKLRLDAEVRRANERFTLAEAAVPGWIYDYDWQTGTVMRSDGFSRLLGYTPAECQPTAAWWQSLIHPDDWQWLAQEIGPLSPQGDLRLLEYRVRDRDGHYHYIWDRAHVIRDESGAIIRLVGSSVDISERKQAEAALQQSNAILSGVLESSNDAIFVRDLAGRYLLVNNAGAAQVGLPKGALLGRRYQEIFDAATVATMDNDDRPVLTQGITVTLEHVNEQHGVMRYWHTLKTPLRNADGAITGLISSARDFTERKAMEDALRRNEARFRAVQQATPDGYMIFESVRDEQGVIRDFRWLYLNPASEQMVGRTAQDLLGKCLLEEMPGNRQAGLFDAYVQVVETGAVSQREFGYQHEGIDRWFRNTAAKAGDGFAVAFSDITARKQAEVDQQMLADLAEQLRVADDADELVAATVRLLGDHLQVGRCLWIEIYGAQQRGAVRAQHCRGLPPVTEVYEQADYNPATLSELAAGHILVNHDAQQDSRTAALYETIYAPYQERAYIGVPFLREGVWRGILSVTASTPRQWQAREISLLETAAERVWLAVDKLRLVAELRINEARYRTIFDHAGVSLWEEDFSRVKGAVDELITAWRAAGVTDLATAMRAHCAAHPAFVQAMLERVRILDVNAETVRLYGRPKADLLRPFPQHFVPETLNRFVDQLALIAAGQPRYTFDGPVETPQGAVRHIASTVVFPSETDGDFTRVLLSGLDVTALKAAEVENRRLLLETQSLLAQVQEGERFLQSIADTIPNVIYLFDLRTMRNRYANRHLAITLGYTAAEVQALGDQFIPALIHPDDQRYLADHLTHLDTLTDGAMADWEYRMKHKGGEWRWLNSREIVFERDEQGRPTVILGSVQDSTARKEAEVALRTSEARFRHLAEAMPQLVWTCRADGSLTYINQQWHEYSGIAPAVTVDEGMWSAMHPADEAANREQWRHALSSGQAYEGEVRLRRHDGAYRWFLERAIPVRDEGGAIQQWFGLSMEIHDRKEAEQRQAELVALLEALLANAPVGFAFLDREQRFVRINQMLAEQHGRPIADHLGRTFAEIAPRAAKTTSPILAQVLTTGAGIYNREISGPKVANPDEIIHALASWFPVAVNGVTQYVGSMIVDITERKRQERHQQFLSELGMDLRLLSDTTTIVTQVVSRLGDYLQVAGCRINEVDQQRAQFTLQKDWVAADAPWAAVVTPGVYPLRELAAPALLAALQAGQTVMVTNTLHDSRTALVAETYENDQVHSLIGVPIFHQNEWRATLSVKGYGERHWRPDEVALVEAVASQLSALLEKVRAEEALRTSEERLRLALAGGGMGIWESQVATNRSIWSPEEYALFGLAPGVEITNALFNTLVHPDDLPGLQAALTHLIAAGSDHTGEFRIIRPDGAVRWLADRVTVIRDESGQPVRLLGINFDITERKEREAMIRQQLAEIEAIYATAPVGLCLVDRALRYVRINETLATINGSTIAEQLGRTLAQTQPAEGYQIIEPLYRGVIETGIPLLNREVHESHVDPAQARDWLASYYPLKNVEGVVTGVNAVILEITERKRQERQLQELNASLEERVLERTKALAQANRELEQFTYAAAHDLRTPLRGIANLVQWISEDATPMLSPESQRHLDKLGGRVKRLEKMLEDLLAYSRVGRVRYQPETVDVQQLVQSLLDLLAPPTGFVVKASPQLPTFTALRVPLELVFRNLLSNAIRHHHDPTNGQAEITVRALDDWYEFCISDNGPGIDPQYHERIFGMFQTLKPRDQVEGSGIGLALVKKTVESVGGQIRMASALGQGTAFYFTWPKG